MEPVVTNQDPSHPSPASDNRDVNSQNREGDLGETFVRQFSTLEDSPRVVTEYGTLDLKEFVEESMMRVAKLVTEKLDGMEKKILEEINGTRGNLSKKNKFLAPLSPKPNSESEDAAPAVRRLLSNNSMVPTTKNNVRPPPSPNPSSRSEAGAQPSRNPSSRSEAGAQPSRGSELSSSSSIRSLSCLITRTHSSRSTNRSTIEQDTDQSPSLLVQHIKVPGKNDVQKKIAKGKYAQRNSAATPRGSRARVSSAHAQGMSTVPPSLLSLEKALDDMLIEDVKIEDCKAKQQSHRSRPTFGHSTVLAHPLEPEQVSEEHVPNEREESQTEGGHDMVADVHQSLAERTPHFSNTPAFLRDRTESRDDDNNNQSGFLWRMMPAASDDCPRKSHQRRSTVRRSRISTVLPTSVSMSSLSQGRSDQLVQQAMDMAKSITDRFKGRDEVTDDDDDISTHLDFFSAFWLCISGIVNWSDEKYNNSTFVRKFYITLNRSVMLVLMLGILVVCTYEIASLRNGVWEETCDMFMCMEHFLAPVAALGLGCFLRLVSLFYYNDHVLGHVDSLLTIYLQSAGVLDAWNSSLRRDMLKICALWLCWMGLCVYTSLGWNIHVTRTSLHLAVIAVSTNVFCAFVFHMMQICKGLFLLLDSFCLTTVSEESCEGAANRWNTLMAIQKRVCLTVARTYILLLSSAIAALMFPISIGSNFVAILPGAFAILLMLWVSFSISAVTSRCERVPAFINTLDFNGDSFDFERQYVVDYIIHSRAGFYMFDVRVTAETVVKTAYVGSVIAVAFASNRANI